MTEVQQKNELTAIPPKASAVIEPIIPRSMEELKYVAGLVVKCGLAPDSYENDPQKIAIGIMKGMEVGLAPLTALSNIAIVNKRPCIWGDGAVALMQSRNVVTKMEKVQVGTKPGENATLQQFPDDYGYEVRIWRKGQEEPYIGRFTVGDARRSKLWMHPKKQPWMLYPDRMLFNRARAFAIRDGFADCLAGLHIREEVEDIPVAAPKPTASFLDDGPVIDAQPTLPPAPAQPDISIWRISDELEFGAEFSRQLAEVVEGPTDIEHLVKANEDRLTPELAEVAERRRQELSNQ